MTLDTVLVFYYCLTNYRTSQLKVLAIYQVTLSVGQKSKKYMAGSLTRVYKAAIEFQSFLLGLGKNPLPTKRRLSTRSVPWRNSIKVHIFC